MKEVMMRLKLRTYVGTKKWGQNFDHKSVATVKRGEILQCNLIIELILSDF